MLFQSYCVHNKLSEIKSMSLYTGMVMHHRYPLNKSCLKLIFSYLLVLIPACDIGNKENGNNEYTNFSLEDINPNSPTFGDLIGPSFYIGNASGYYFGDQG